MKYDQFAIDLDGTLLNPVKKISKQNLYAVVKYMEFGGEPIICTGRSYSSVKIYIKQIQAKTNKKIN
jgi:hydroxymethylpyrimidine pyrophosphatase-like HAD family hydrolase